MHDSVRVDQTIKCAKETSDCTLQLLYLIDIWKNLETKKNIVNSHLKGEVFPKNSSKKLIIYLANFFEFWRLNKSSSKGQVIKMLWFDEGFFLVVENENPSTLAFITLLIESLPADTLRIFLMAADGGEHHDSKVIFFFLLSTLKACVFKVVSCQYFPINGEICSWNHEVSKECVCVCFRKCKIRAAYIYFFFPFWHSNILWYKYFHYLNIQVI